jgi:prepilin-type N-terminal cleavage/methylation domain-containing protein
MPALNSAANRSGFTLVEMVVATALLAVVGGAVASSVATQWRSHDSLAGSEHARQALDDAASLLLAELRALSPAAGDLASVTDTSLEVRATLGTSVICSVTVTRDRFFLPPRQPSSGAALTSWRDAAIVGDSIEILDSRGAFPDTLSRHELLGIGGGVCPTSSGFAKTPGDAASGIELRVSPVLPTGVVTGAPVRIVRAARYSIYRSPADRRWYLGIKEMKGGFWSVVQPVAGPFLPAAAGNGGLAITIRDSSGASLTSPAGLTGARLIEIALRAGSPRRAVALGRATAVSESLHVDLAPRNQ